jgi:hypothetical protein
VASGDRGSGAERVLAWCLRVLLAAAALSVAARLIVSIAAALTIIVALIGTLLITALVGRAAWRAHRSNRW